MKSVQTDRPLALALVVFCVGACLLAPAARADGTLDAPTSAVIGGAPGVVFVQFDGIFSGRTSTGAYRVPYRITIPAPPARTNGTVVVEPPHFALGLGALEQLLGLRFLLSRGFAHAGIGWSTASFGDGLDLRILDPGADRVFIDGGVTDGNGRTDDEIVVDFARALTSDGHARAMLGRVDRRYLTGFSDSSDPVLRLVASGRAEGAFEFVLPVVAEAHESPIGPRCRALSRQGHRRRLRGRVRQSSSTRGVAGGRSRSYAVAGTPHMPDFLGFPFLTTMSTPASFEPELRAHFLHGHRWVADGKAAAAQHATSKPRATGRSPAIATATPPP